MSDLYKRVHRPLSYVTLAHDASVVGWAFTAVLAITTIDLKGIVKRMMITMFKCIWASMNRDDYPLLHNHVNISVVGYAKKGKKKYLLNMLHVHVLREESLPTGIWILCLRKHVCITYTIHELLYVILIVRFFRKFLYAFSIATIFYYVMRSEIIYLCHLLPSVPHESSGFVQMLRVTLNTILIIFCSNRKLFFFYRKQTVLIFSYK